ncbi:MAG: hypothetical protein AB8G86_23110 [Saprospiraceae bacterium]
MNTVLLILGLTAIYYIVLFYFDNKRKKAFQLAKNNAIGKTTEFPIIEEIQPENLFGKTDQLEKPLAILTNTIAQKAMVAKNLVHEHSAKNLKEDLAEITIDLDTDETFETNQKDLIESLKKANPEEVIGEEEISAFIQSPQLSTKVLTEQTGRN